MAWSFDWLRSWDEVWDPRHVARWRAMCEAAGGARHAVHPPRPRPRLARGHGRAVGLRSVLPARQALRRPAGVLAARPAEARLAQRHPAAAGAGGRRAGRTAFRLQRSARGAGDGAGRRCLRAASGRRSSASFARMRGRGSTAAAFTASAPSAWARRSAEPVVQGSTYVRLDAYADFEAYAAARPPGLASQVRRKLRRLEADGRCVLHMHGPGEREAALAWLPDLEAAQLARYPESGLPPGFLRSLVTEGFDSGLVRCSVLRIDGRRRAGGSTICSAGRFTWRRARSTRRCRSTRPGSCTPG